MDSFKDVLEAAQAYCKTQMAEPTYNLYIDGLEPISFEDSSHITLSVRNDFICKIVTDRYLGLLKEAFKTVLGFDVDITLVVPSTPPHEVVLAQQYEANPASPQGNYEFTFENFIKGPSKLAIPLYEKIDLLKENAAAIIAGIAVGTLVSLGSALALALALDLTREQYATLLPKSVTTAISMDVAAELGGIAALTGAIVIVTGIVGALLAETVCKLFHITDPIAKGVGIGTAAHAVGTSKALQMGEVEGAMSGLSIAVAGVLTAVLCPVFVNLIR